MARRILPSADLKLIDDRRLVYEGMLGQGSLQAASFQTADRMGVIVSIEPETPQGEAFHISVTRPDRPPTDDDLAVVRIAVCGAGSHARIVTPEHTMLPGRIVHLLEEPHLYEPPDAPWLTPEDFAAMAAEMAEVAGLPPERGAVALATLERQGLVRVERRADPDHGELVRVDMRALAWRTERRRGRQA